MNNLPKETSIILRLESIRGAIDNQENLTRIPIIRTRKIIPKKITAKHKEKRKATFKPKTLTTAEIATSIVQKPTSIKVHYDGKSKEPNDMADQKTETNESQRNSEIESDVESQHSYYEDEPPQSKLRR